MVLPRHEHPPGEDKRCSRRRCDSAPGRGDQRQGPPSSNCLPYLLKRARPAGGTAEMQLRLRSALHRLLLPGCSSMSRTCARRLERCEPAL
jgi:hypothetical protein